MSATRRNQKRGLKSRAVAGPLWQPLRGGTLPGCPFPSGKLKCPRCGRPRRFSLRRYHFSLRGSPENKFDWLIPCLVQRRRSCTPITSPPMRNSMPACWSAETSASTVSACIRGTPANRSARLIDRSEIPLSWASLATLHPNKSRAARIWYPVGMHTGCRVTCRMVNPWKPLSVLSIFCPISPYSGLKCRQSGVSMQGRGEESSAFPGKSAMQGLYAPGCSALSLRPGMGFPCPGTPRRRERGETMPDRQQHPSRSDTMKIFLIKPRCVYQIW